MRIAVLFDNFGPYHYARLNAAASVMEVIGIETVAQSREYAWRSNAEARFQRVTLYPELPAAARRLPDLARRLAKALSVARPDAVAIPGWSDAGAFAALRWCSAAGVPAIVMSESTADDEPRVVWREAIKRRIVALYSTALVGGERHVDYLAQLGMPRERIFLGYDAVDNAYFAARADEIRGGKVGRLERGDRADFPEHYFLASARFIPKKNLAGLIRAYADYVRRCESEWSLRGQSDMDEAQRVRERERSNQKWWSLVLLGDGPLRESLNSQLSTLNLHAHVHLPGFKQYGELPVYYANAKAFVHASTSEQWGLVVNEAMASGLPVIVSERCGCAPELVREGVNGWTFDPANEEQLTERLCRMAALPEDERARFGAASQEIVSGFGVERFAEGLRQAAEVALQLPRKRAGVVDRALLSALMRR